MIHFPGNQIEPAQNHPAVPSEDVISVYNYIQNGQSFQEALKLLRQSKFPNSYEPHPWVTGIQFFSSIYYLYILMFA